MNLEPFGPPLNRPAGVAVSADCDVWVAEWGAAQVVRLSPDGVERARLGSPGAAPGELNGPVHVAFGPAGEVYVADWGNDRVQRLTPDPVVWGEAAGAEPGAFRHAAGLAVGEDGTVYIGDAGNNRVQLLTPDGTVIAIWEGFDDPGGITLHQGQLYIVEGRAHCVTRVAADGAVEERYGGPSIFDSPHAVGIASNGNLYVADTKHHRVQVLSTGGALLASWGDGVLDRTFGLAVADDVLYVSDFENGRLWKGRIFSPGGP